VDELVNTYGLTENEAKIYRFLLRGSITTGPILKATGIANSRVYAALESLIKKGIVTYTIQKEGKHFSAVDPSILIEKQKEKEQKLAELVKELKRTEKKEEKTNTLVYEGFNGFKSAFAKIIGDCPQGGTISVLGFSQPSFASKSLEGFITKMNKTGAAKKQKLKIILSESVRKTAGKSREREPFSEVRYIADDYMSPAAVDIFEDYTYIFLWEEKPFVFAIKNKLIAESFKQYFNALWKNAEKAK